MNVELSQLAKEHYLAHKKMRLLAEAWMNQAAKRLNQVDPTSMTAWSQVLERAIQGEREATGMKYEDINQAIEFLTKYGYTISDSQEET